MSNKLIYSEYFFDRLYYFRKDIATELFLKENDVVIIDPENNCEFLTSHFSGISVRVGNDKSWINPFDLKYINEDDMRLKVNFLMCFFNSIYHNTLTSDMQCLIVNCIEKTYKQYFNPTLYDFYKIFSANDRYKISGRVLEIMEKYPCLMQPSNIDKDIRLVRYDLSGIDEDYRDLFMMIILDFIHNHNYKSSTPTTIYIDKVDSIVKKDTSFDYLKELFEKSEENNSEFVLSYENLTTFFSLQNLYMIANADETLFCTIPENIRDGLENKLGFEDVKFNNIMNDNTNKYILSNNKLTPLQDKIVVNSWLYYLSVNNEAPTTPYYNQPF